jgi:hypothetical protein
MELLDLQDTLEYAEYPEKILDRAVKETTRTTIPFCKVLWSNHTEREATWKKEADLTKEYPHLFTGEVGVYVSRTIFSVVGENVTNQKIRCENLQKFKTFLFGIGCYQFSNQTASPFLILPLKQPIYKNINSNYGKNK